MKVLLQTLMLLSYAVQQLMDPIVTESTSNSNVTTKGTTETTKKVQFLPSINSSNSDLCTVGVSGAVQTANTRYKWRI